MTYPDSQRVRPFIRIVRYPYEEPWQLHLEITASNGRQVGCAEIYVNASDLSGLSQALLGFPKKADDTIVWELGSERAEDRFAYYYRIRASQIRTSGMCAIEVRYCNNLPAPVREVMEFSIVAWPADLDRLADLLQRFSALEHSVLEWHVTEGELLN